MRSTWATGWTGARRSTAWPTWSRRAWARRGSAAGGRRSSPSSPPSCIPCPPTSSVGCCTVAPRCTRRPRREPARSWERRSSRPRRRRRPTGCIPEADEGGLSKVKARMLSSEHVLGRCRESRWVHRSLRTRRFDRDDVERQLADEPARPRAGLGDHDRVAADDVRSLVHRCGRAGLADVACGGQCAWCGAGGRRWIGGMMNETMMTVSGNLVSDVDFRVTTRGDALARFRVASTVKRYDRASGRWLDGDTTYWNVTAWRRAAENAAKSLAKGHPVLVHGKVRQRTVDREVAGAPGDDDGRDVHRPRGRQLRAGPHPVPGAVPAGSDRARRPDRSRRSASSGSLEGVADRPRGSGTASGRSAAGAAPVEVRDRRRLSRPEGVRPAAARGPVSRFAGYWA